MGIKLEPQVMSVLEWLEAIASRALELERLSTHRDADRPPTDTVEGIERFGRLADLLIMAGYTTREVKSDRDR